MNQRIRSIFWLMTFCIVGINAFQGYWLWTTYQLNRQQFSRTVQEVLFSVVEQRQMVEANRLFTRQEDGINQQKGLSHLMVRQVNTSPGGQQIRIVVAKPADTLLTTQTSDQPVQKVIVAKEIHTKATGMTAATSADTLARRISSLLLLDWTEGTRVNVSKLSAAYRTELLRHGIDAHFRLDTLSIHPQHSEDNVLVFRSPFPAEPAEARDTLQTMPVPINPVRSLFAQASFATPTFYLLRSMGWLLGSSVFLLALTTGCFLFMLSTILRQKKLSDVKNDFINNMTHELKTPIATVTAAVEAMQHFGALNDPQKTQTYLTISQTNLQRLSDLVEKVLNLAVEEKRELVLQPELVNLRELTNNLITNHQLRSARSITFTVGIPTDAIVQVDRIHFGNALNNLIDNAIKYSHDVVNIHIQFRQNTNGWQLSVTDNGIGIPKTYQTAVFDRFFRVPTGDLHPVKGFGLGLAYVRQVIERHGGRISVQSEPGKGSEFSIVF